MSNFQAAIRPSQARSEHALQVTLTSLGRNPHMQCISRQLTRGFTATVALTDGVTLSASLQCVACIATSQPDSSSVCRDLSCPLHSSYRAPLISTLVEWTAGPGSCRTSCQRSGVLLFWLSTPACRTIAELLAGPRTPRRPTQDDTKGCKRCIRESPNVFASASLCSTGCSGVEAGG